MAHTLDTKATRTIRWVARITAALMVTLTLLIFVGEGLSEGFQPLLNMTARETAMMVSFIAVWLGLLLAWKWEAVGGLLTVLGSMAFYAINYLFSGYFPRGPFFLILASPSLLFLYCAYKSGKKAESQSV